MAYTAFTRPENYTGTITDKRGDVHHYIDSKYMGTDTKPAKTGPGETMDFSRMVIADKEQDGEESEAQHD
jgi:hypothetical protein